MAILRVEYSPLDIIELMENGTLDSKTLTRIEVVIPCGNMYRMFPEGVISTKNPMLKEKLVIIESESKEYVPDYCIVCVTH